MTNSAESIMTTNAIMQYYPYGALAIQDEHYALFLVFREGITECALVAHPIDERPLK